ncbi:MAG TPA: hypothetical protein VLZ77_03610 [Acidimicrobiales bacterium]|nr:hypothetical protein [Acidimicrobiales bacterium]
MVRKHDHGFDQLLHKHSPFGGCAGLPDGFHVNLAEQGGHVGKTFSQLVLPCALRFDFSFLGTERLDLPSQACLLVAERIGTDAVLVVQAQQFLPFG